MSQAFFLNLFNIYIHNNSIDFFIYATKINYGIMFFNFLLKTEKDHTMANSILGKRSEQFSNPLFVPNKNPHPTINVDQSKLPSFNKPPNSSGSSKFKKPRRYTKIATNVCQIPVTDALVITSQALNKLKENADNSIIVSEEYEELYLYCTLLRQKKSIQAEDLQILLTTLNKFAQILGESEASQTALELAESIYILKKTLVELNIKASNEEINRAAFYLASLKNESVLSLVKTTVVPPWL